MTNIFKRKMGKPNAFPYGKRVILRPFHRSGMGKPNAFPQKGLVEAEYEPNGCDEADAGSDMIPAKLHVKRHHAEEDEHAERDNFLNHLELHKVERSSVIHESYPVGRHLGAVFEKCDSP